MIQKSIINENSLLYEILEHPGAQRLKSRPVLNDLFESLLNFNLDVEWSLAWKKEQFVNMDLLVDPIRVLS